MLRSVFTTLMSVFAFMLAAGQIYGDIDEWAYLNPSNPSDGVYQSTILCPSGSGVNAAQNADLSGLNLTQAYLVAVNLANANLDTTNLTTANCRMAP